MTMLRWYRLIVMPRRYSMPIHHLLTPMLVISTHLVTILERRLLVSVRVTKLLRYMLVHDDHLLLLIMLMMLITFGLLLPGLLTIVHHDHLRRLNSPDRSR